MPSSVGHALAGLAVSRLFGGRLRANWPHVLIAVAPDLDIVGSAIRRRAVDYAHRRSHSFGAALATGIAVGGAAWLLGGRFVPHALKGTTTYASHLLLDYFGKDAQNGLPLLWPGSDRLFAADRPIFATIYSSRDHFFAGLMTSRNLRRVAREIVLLGPAVAIAELVGRGRGRGRIWRRIRR